jgi:hypothetical protein
VTKKVFNIEEFFAYLQNNDLLTNIKNLVKMHRIFLHWAYQDELNYGQLKGVVEDISSIIGKEAFSSITLKDVSKYSSSDLKKNTYKLENVTIDPDMIGKEENIERRMKSVW